MPKLLPTMPVHEHVPPVESVQRAVAVSPGAMHVMLAKVADATSRTGKSVQNIAKEMKGKIDFKRVKSVRNNPDLGELCFETLRDFMNPSMADLTHLHDGGSVHHSKGYWQREKHWLGQDCFTGADIKYPYLGCPRSSLSASKIAFGARRPYRSAVADRSNVIGISIGSSGLQDREDCCS